MSGVPKDYTADGDQGRPMLLVRRFTSLFSSNPSSSEVDDFIVLGIGKCQFGDFDPRLCALLLPIEFRIPPSWPTVHGRLLTDPIDWTIVQQWLKFCDEQYAEIRTSDQQLVLSGMKFIDCRTLQTAQPTGPPPPYITLSYLWDRAGHDTDHNAKQISLLTMPLVVEDAVQVVKMLDYRYLWVDRYCIPQEDCPEKRALIYNMDQIYRCGTLNHVANGEKFSEYGLPGAGSIPRVMQPTARIGLEEYDSAGSTQRSKSFNQYGIHEAGHTKNSCFQ